MPKLLGETTRRDAAGRRRHACARWRLSNSAEAIAGAHPRADDAARFDAAAARRFTCPTLIVVGDEDTLTPPALAKRCTARIAGSELVVIPGGRPPVATWNSPKRSTPRSRTSSTIGYSRTTGCCRSHSAMSVHRWSACVRCRAASSALASPLGAGIADAARTDRHRLPRPLRARRRRLLPRAEERPREARRLRQRARRGADVDSCRATSSSRSG